MRTIRYINTKHELKKAMEQNNITREDIAGSLNITTQAVWKWLKGRCPIPVYAGLWFYHHYGIKKGQLKAVEKVEH